MTRRPIIDVDVHNSWASPADLVAYLPPRWRDYYAATGTVRAPVIAQLTYSRPGGTTSRLDAQPPGGGLPGSDYEVLRAQLLDRHDIDRALLTFPLGAEAAFHNSPLAVELCRAANAWMADHWLDGRDRRLCGVAMIPTGAPHEAVAEIERMAGKPGVAGILMAANPLNRPFGNRVYEPIYSAVAETGLPLVLHIGGDLRNLGTGFAAGSPTSRADHFALTEQAAIHHLVSMIAGGVFARHPRLRLLFNECGVGWIPSVFWALDAQYRVLKLESPDLDRLPSEYLRAHVWISSQPLDTVAAPRRMIELIECFGGLEDRICFSSDYPHHDSENPAQVTARLPASWHQRVLGGNAAELFGWDLDAIAREGRNKEDMRWPA